MGCPVSFLANVNACSTMEGLTPQMSRPCIFILLKLVNKLTFQVITRDDVPTDCLLITTSGLPI